MAIRRTTLPAIMAGAILTGAVAGLPSAGGAAQTVGPPIGGDRTISQRATADGNVTEVETTAGRNWRRTANEAGAFLQSDVPVTEKIAEIEADHAAREPIWLFVLFQLHMLEGDLDKAAYWGRLARARVAYDVGRCADGRGNPWRSSLIEIQQYIDDDLKTAVGERLNASADALAAADLRAREELLNEPDMMFAVTYSPWWACSNMANVVLAATEGEDVVLTEAEWLLPAFEWPAVQDQVAASVRAPLETDDNQD